MYSESSFTNLKNLSKRVLKAGLGRDHLLRPEIRLAKRRLGSTYGGWWIAPEVLPPARAPVVLSFGIGDDISFDLDMIRLYAADVYAFDPTPKSIAWLAAQTDLPAQFKAFPVGVAAFDGEQSFGMPSQPDWDDFSVLRTTALTITCPVQRIATLLRDLALPEPDILKLDVEGAEYAVLDDLLATRLRPAQLLVEFHHASGGPAVSQTTQAIGRLRAQGYRIFDVSPWGKEFSLVHQTGLDRARR